MTAAPPTKTLPIQAACDAQFNEPCPEAVQGQFRLLQTVLNHLCLPEMVDRRDQPRSAEHWGVTVVVLAELEEALNIFLEGNRQCPGGVLLAMSASSMSRRPSPDHEDMDTLYVHQAITADRGGQTYLDTFSPPRRVTYLVNHMTRFTTESRRSEGEELASFGLDTPTSSSMALNARADDKLLTTAMCAAVGVPHPVTLGFWLADDDSSHNHYPKHCATVTAIKLNSSCDLESRQLEAKVKDFLNTKPMAVFEKVVVKPFGPSWNSCKGVSFHDSCDVTGIVKAVLDLLKVLDPGNGILVQSYHPTFDPIERRGFGRHAILSQGTNLGFRVRTIVTRTPYDTARMTQVVCAISADNKPIGGVNSTPASLELTLQQWGVTDLRQQRRVRHSLRHCSERLMMELMRQEKSLTSQQRGGHGSQTELIGIDFILTKMKGEILPVMIEVNAHDCLYHVTVLETMQPHLRGQATRTYVHTMLDRSQKFMMRNKTVVVVGAGGFSKRNIWKDARQYGVKVILVDSNPNHLARHEVHEFLHVDFDDHTQDKQHAATILAALAERLPGVLVDGCLTFWEDCVPLAALVGEGLHLSHTPSFRAAMNAKSKVKTQRVLWDQDKEPPHELPLRVYASPSVKINNERDLEKAVAQVPLPAVLKLEFGSSAVGVKHVHNYQDALKHVQQVQHTLRSEADHPGVGLGHGQTLLLMPRLVGTEHDVDLVLFEGQLVAAFLSDNGPTRFPACVETAAVLPSVLRKEQQRQLISAAASCCRGLGLTTGVFNVEMMLGACGPKLIEVNARMGGFYNRDWIRSVYNADLLHFALMCACGVRPVLTGLCSLDDKEDYSGCNYYDDVIYDIDDAGWMNGFENKAGDFHGEGRMNGVNCDVIYNSSDDLTKDSQDDMVLINGSKGDDAESKSDINGVHSGVVIADKNGTYRIDVTIENSQDNSDSFNIPESLNSYNGFNDVISEEDDVSRVIGVMLYPSRHGNALKTTATPQRLKLLHEKGEIIFTQFEPEVTDFTEGESFEEAFGNLAVKAAGVERAKSKLVTICTQLGLETEDSLRESLQDFIRLT